jgi:hypothetical protein
MKSLTVQEIATILGALRLYQSQGFADHPENRPDWLHAIVTRLDDDTSLDGAGVDGLCERLNLGGLAYEPCVEAPRSQADRDAEAKAWEGGAS